MNNAFQRVPRPKPDDPAKDRTHFARSAQNDTKPKPRGEPAKTYAVNATGEVRAGPGDAGAQDAPHILNDPPNNETRSRAPLVWGVFAGALVLLLVFLLSV